MPYLIDKIEEKNDAPGYKRRSRKGWKILCIVNISSEKRREQRDEGSLDGRAAAISLVMNESYIGELK